MRSYTSRRAGDIVEAVSLRLGHPSMLSASSRESTQSVRASSTQPANPLIREAR